MADEADMAQAVTDGVLELGTRMVAIEASRIPEGKEGECDFCGEHTMRLVEGACAPCRDRYKLP